MGSKLPHLSGSRVQATGVLKIASEVKCYFDNTLLFICTFHLYDKFILKLQGVYVILNTYFFSAIKNVMFSMICHDTFPRDRNNVM